MPGSDIIVWDDEWVPTGCVITSPLSVRKEIEEHAKKYPFDVWKKLVKKLSYIGILKKPISNKEYMYRIDNDYYECYIFGQKLKERLTFSFHVVDGITYISIGAITNHGGVKKRVGRLNSGLETDDFDYDDDVDYLMERYHIWEM